jgi:hypothetical protein
LLPVYFYQLSDSSLKEKRLVDWATQHGWVDLGLVQIKQEDWGGSKAVAPLFVCWPPLS